MKINEFSIKQSEILKFIFDNRNYIICDGAVRSGKTVIMIISYIMWAMENFNETNFAICGKTVSNAERNIIKPLQSVEDLPYKLRYKLSNRCLTVYCGNRKNYFYCFGGKDESSYMLIQGITLAGVFLDEVALMPRTFVDQAMARTLTFQNAKIWFNCNPESPKHWFYQDWVLKSEERNAKHLHFLMSDNPIMTDAEIQRASQTYSGVFYDRYIRGLWVVAEGLVYQNFSEEKHVIDFNSVIESMDEQRKSHFKRTAQYYTSCDYGITNPFACYVWCLYEKTAYCIKEYYFDSREVGRRKTDEEHYTSIDSMIGDLVIQYFVIDPSANSFKEVIYRHDKYDILNAKNDVLNGISNVTTLLDTDHIKIDKSCKKLIEEFGLYRWDDKSETDEVIKEFDHALDSLRYMCMTVLRHEFDWFDWGN